MENKRLTLVVVVLELDPVEVVEPYPPRLEVVVLVVVVP